MAYGVLASAEEFGLSVPGDIALVGFDDDAPSAHVRPALTTIRQPNYEMGQQGITLLLSILNTPGFTGNDTYIAKQLGRSFANMEERLECFRHRITLVPNVCI